MTTLTKNPNPKKTSRAPQRSSAKRGSVSDPSKALESLMKLGYPVELIEDDGVFVASHPDLPGCISFGDSPNEAIRELKSVRELWMTAQLESGHPIPEPSSPDSYSGKFVLRIPKMLHRMADFRARQEGVSLNAFITSLVAGALHYPMEESISVHLSMHRPAERLKSLDAWQHVGMNTLWRVSGHTPTPDITMFTQAFAEKIGGSDEYAFNPLQLEGYHDAKREEVLACK